MKKKNLWERLASFRNPLMFQNKWFYGKKVLPDLCYDINQFSIYHFNTTFIQVSHHGRDRMVVVFTTTCAISAYHH
jgi:hypothetical protein